jgi:endonuclease/exonuclease/phosphatase (EEP) superfamily protein YafD
MRNLGRTFLTAGFIGIALVGLGGLLAPFFWQGEMINPFRPQILLMSGIALAASLLLHDKRLTGLGLAVMALNAFPMAERLLMMQRLPAPAVEAQNKVSIISANVLCDNRQFDRVIAMIRRENPDIFVAVETSPAWLDGLKPLENLYPYRMTPNLGIFGLSVYAKEPFTAHVDHIGRAEMPLAELHFDDMTLLVAHPMPPVAMQLAQENKQYLEVLARRVKETPGHVIIAGDLNTTLWSRNIAPLLAEKVQWPHGSGLTHTWPSDSPWLAIQIDHIFTKGAVAGRYKVLEPVGSDHYPVRADLVF